MFQKLQVFREISAEISWNQWQKVEFNQRKRRDWWTENGDIRQKHTKEMDIKQHYLGFEPTTDEIAATLCAGPSHKPRRRPCTLLRVRYLGSIERASHCALLLEQAWWSRSCLFCCCHCALHSLIGANGFPWPPSSTCQHAVATHIQATMGTHVPAGVSGYQDHLGDILPHAPAAINSTPVTTSQQHLPAPWRRQQRAVAKLRASGSQSRLGTAPQTAWSASNPWCLKPKSLKRLHHPRAWRWKCNGSDLTGANGSLWALCNTWANALGQLLAALPALLDCLAAPTGADGALLQLGSTSPSASNALQEFQMDLLWPQWLGAQTGVNGSPVLPGSTWEAV